MQRLALLVTASVWLGAKGATEVVLAHYSEDLAWLQTYAGPGLSWRVYSKAEDAAQVPSGAERLPNVGREGHTYLHHVVSNYHALAEWTVFSQAGAPSHGYQGQGSGGGHLTGSVTFGDYLHRPEGADALFFFTSAVQLPSIDHCLRVDFALNDTSFASNDRCPRPEDGWTKWFHMERHQAWLEAKRHKLGELEPLAFYQTYISERREQLDSLVLNFAQGARFAVSREAIHRRPKDYYVRLLDALAQDSDPAAGYWMEFMWYDVFHPEKLQVDAGTPCELPSYAPVSQWDMVWSLTHHGEVREQLQSVDPRRLASGPQPADATDIDNIVWPFFVIMLGVGVSGVGYYVYRRNTVSSELKVPAPWPVAPASVVVARTSLVDPWTQKQRRPALLRMGSNLDVDACLSEPEASLHSALGWQRRRRG
eukprot:scaffold7381_cov310-Pinguiococcus_pyrenoidosus.AAC.141